MSRLPRDEELREETSRTEEWNPASLLPDPDPMDGWRMKWVRKTILGETDVMNMSRRTREGWVPVSCSDQPAIASSSESTEVIEIGGLILCKLPEERAQARQRHFRNLANQQVEGLSTSMRKEAQEDRRMPLEEVRQTKVSRSPG